MIIDDIHFGEKRGTLYAMKSAMLCFLTSWKPYLSHHVGKRQLLMNVSSITCPHKLTKFFCLVSLLLPMAGTAWAALPPGWSDADIGSPGLAGSAGYTNGLWTVTGGGSDIWNTADQFNFASTNYTGDGTMIVLVTSLQNSDPGSGWSKAGLMFRNDSTAGSANVSIVATAGQGVSFQWRSTARRLQFFQPA